MNTNKKLIWSMVLMVVLATIVRLIPGRPGNFAPQWAIAIFGGAVIKDKRYAFIIPVLSMLISDLIFQGLYVAGLSSVQGFYRGQVINCLLFGTVALFGYLIKKIDVVSVGVVSLLAPTYFFIVSNFLTWAGVGEYVEYSKDWKGLMECYTAAFPFYLNSLIATVLFSGMLFGAWYLINRPSAKRAIA
ncbi:MAG: hypothetical protein QM731_26895 [Chitinophagaceae bacterium]